MAVAIRKKPKKIRHKVADALSQEWAKFFWQTVKFLIDLSAHTFDKKEEADGKGMM